VDFTAFTIEIGQELTSGGAIWSGGAEEQNQSTFHSVVDFEEAAMRRRHSAGAQRVLQGR
jgi:hypothetical protein